MELTRLVERYLLVWILLAVGLGAAIPELAVITRASTPILAVMVGSISLTLTVAAFRAIDPTTVARVLVGHLAMPLIAYVVAAALGLNSALTTGFVVLGAVTPELVTPVMTELAEGQTALSTTVLVLSGLGSVAVVPVALGLFGGDVAVSVGPIVAQLAVAVVVPMLVAVSLRHRYPARIGRYDEVYPAISALMVILIIGGVTAANAGVLRSSTAPLTTIAIGAAALNVAGYGLGYLLGWGRSEAERTAAVLSVGMRDFAVAAGLVVAAGLPTLATLPAVVFGIIEMTTSAGLVRLSQDR